MSLRGGQLILHEADQLGREWSDVPAEGVGRFDQRRVEEVMAAEDQGVERNQSGGVKWLGLGHEPDGAGVASPATPRRAETSSSATARAVTAKTVAAKRRPSVPTSATSPSSSSWTSSRTSISSS